MKILSSIYRKYSKLSVEVRRYLLVGISVYLFELLVIAGAIRAGAADVLAVGISFWSGLLVSFVLQKMLTFGDTRTHYKVLLPQLVAYGLLVLFNFGFTLLVTALLADYIPATVSRTVALGITVIWNFYLYKTRIFQRQDQSTPKRNQRVDKTRPQNGRLELHSELLARLYAGFSLSILLLTTTWWSWLGARLHASNADQLVNPQLFESAATWHQSVLPDTHSFLLKWPVFFLIKSFNFTDAAYMWMTILPALITVAVLAAILWYIERRPYVFASLCLALSSVLLLVPIQPYAGGLIPVSMAMVTTRNIEYVFYVVALLGASRAIRLRDWWLAGSVALLAILIVSDKLFMSMSLGAALLALVMYSIARQWGWLNQAVRWFALAFAATVVALLLLQLLDGMNIVRLAGQSTASPYAAVDDLKNLVLGSIYALAGVLTNMGANPAYDALTLAELPGGAVHHMASEAGAGYIVNTAITLLALFASGQLLWSSLRSRTRSAELQTTSGKLAIALLWSALAAILLFVAADHYYAVDARYLAICMFALFVALTVWLAKKRAISRHIIALAQIPLMIGVVGGVLGSHGQFESQQQALAPIRAQNTNVVQMLKEHDSPILVGDYWRVVPIKHASAGAQAVLPLETCTRPRSVLTNQAWQPDLRGKSFAYLLTLEGSLTDFPNCDLQTVTDHFGLPNNTVLVSGTLAKPKELLLFYDNGQRSGNPHPDNIEHSVNVLPVALGELANTICPVPTIMNIVAHQDDDLLFMNPDLLHDVRDGHCIRNVYITAGDAGGSAPYWLSREQGSRAAFDYMLGGRQQWQTHVVRLPQGQYVTIASPEQNPKISLIFMHLPDGNLHGEGFGGNSMSLASLFDGSAKRLKTVDRQSYYSSQTLIEGLVDIMHTYQPTEIRSQAAHLGSKYPDHSDHLATGRFATAAAAQYQNEQFGDGDDVMQLPVRLYIGYPIRALEMNVVDQDLADKRAAFMAYAQYDSSVCRSRASCNLSDAYTAYLTGQYIDEN